MMAGPKEREAIARMTPGQREQLARMIGESMARRDNLWDLLKVAAYVIGGTALLLALVFGGKP